MKILLLLILFTTSNLVHAKDYPFLAGVFNAQEILMETGTNKKIDKEMEKFIEKKKSILQKLEDKLNNRIEEDNKKMIVYSEDKKATVEAEHTLEKQKIMIAAKKAEKETALYNKKLTESFFQDIEDRVKIIAKKYNLKVVYEYSEKPFFVEKEKDITDEIIQLFKK